MTSKFESKTVLFCVLYYYEKCIFSVKKKEQTQKRNLV